MTNEYSEKIAGYFARMDSEVQTIYTIAQTARSKGYDPELKVEIPLVKNMAERVEGLISSIAPQIIGSGVSERIKELEGTYGSLDWRIGLTIALEIAQGKFCSFKDKKEAIEIGIRVGFAYLTMGTVASPLEGFTDLQFGKRLDDGKEYFVMRFSGPVRSAGGTAASVCVLIGDYVRVNLGYTTYDPTVEEIKRTSTELHDYHERITNLQYLPSIEEIEYLIGRIPVQISGDPSEVIEVSNYKDLPRIPTNQIRNGVCLVVGEGIAQKAPKLWKQLSKWGADFGLAHWAFLEEFLAIQKTIKSKGKSSKSETFTLTPDYTFIKDLVAGRPVLTYPLASGGFRLRYGRSRVSGYSACSIHPATMVALRDYIALGSQLKLERPGKAASMTSCTTIEGPIIKLHDGSVLRAESETELRKLKDQISKILYLGDILISYGDFFNRASTLLPPGYCPEFWIQELEAAVKKLPNAPTTTNAMIASASIISGVSNEALDRIWHNPLTMRPALRESFLLARQLSIPLHPWYTYHWKEITPDAIVGILIWMEHAEVILEGTECEKIVLPLPSIHKNALELIGIPHKVISNQYAVIEKDYASAFLISLGLYMNYDLARSKLSALEHQASTTNGLELVNKIADVQLRDKSGIFVGARMGRPEKGKQRQLTGSPHGLFPVGTEGGRLRSFQAALGKKKITGDFPVFVCESCGKETIFPMCEVCDKPAKRKYVCKYCGLKDETVCKQHGPCAHYKNQEIDITLHITKVMHKLGMNVLPELVKGVRGTSNKDHTPEHLAKPLLRAKHDVYVNKDGTIRYDMTQLPITHFKPLEIGTGVERLVEMGYTHDIHGSPLTQDTQILELLPQDIILPRCENAPDAGADVILLRIAQFVDELLEKFYDAPAYYRCKTPKDLIGVLVMALAPHTSAGIVCRVIGFSAMQGLLASPMIHAATRRDCDGDEACVILLMDALLNFSRHFLPAHRGSTQDAPLVLTGRLVTTEIDDMVFDMDVSYQYPIEFYHACLSYKKPWDVKIPQVKERLKTPGQYEGFGFTHDTEDINKGVLCSAYKLLPSMQEKLEGQMILAEMIRAVDEHDVARLVIEKHFIKDIRGNLRKFSTQAFRCVDCNASYRRPPIIGKCTACGGKLLFTVAQGSVLKYLEPSLSISRKYNLPAYLKQSLELTQDRIESMFGRDKEKQEGLGKWFG